MRVRAVRNCFVGHHWKQGEEGEYAGPKNKNLEPVKTAIPTPRTAAAPKPAAAAVPGEAEEPEKEEPATEK